VRQSQGSCHPGANGKDIRAVGQSQGSCHHGANGKDIRVMRQSQGSCHPGAKRRISGRGLCYNNLQMKEYFVYILTNKSLMLYTGVTDDLERRVFEHKQKMNEGFTMKYNINRLVYFDSTNDVTVAIAREKQIKGMLRNKKIELIKTMNPEFKDLSEDWYK
jgi:putative endonuclease